MKVSVIIACSGSSQRMGGINKLFYPIDNIPVVIKSAMQFDKVDEVFEIVFSVSGDNRVLLEECLKKYPFRANIKLCEGGKTRQGSVLNGFAVCDECDIICVHDGARPFIDHDIIKANIADADKYGCAVVCVAVKDTIKLSCNGFIDRTTDRKSTFIAQTPQSARYEIFKKASLQSGCDDFTDDSQLFEALGLSPKLTQGSYTNIKITTPEDLNFCQDRKNNMIYRIGHGYDVHRLCEGRKLILGGVEIPHTLGLLGHSDADVLTHAIMDSLLGAASLGDIGRLFPDTDEAYKDADSIELLKIVCKTLRESGYSIVNIDSTICAQAPKISPHYEKIAEVISIACEIDKTQVSVKATTEEGLGFTGEKQGISCTAVSMISK